MQKRILALLLALVLLLACAGCADGQVYRGHEGRGDPPPEENTEFPEEGESTELFGNDNHYVGQVKDGKPHGQGTCTWDNGESYSGQWENGFVSGQGIMTYANGDRYEGQWKNGLYDGQGTMTFSGGVVFTCQWKEGIANGQGTVTYPDTGERWLGRWEEGLMEGEFLYMDAQGNTYTQMYEKDELVSDTSPGSGGAGPEDPGQTGTPEYVTPSGPQFLDPLSYYGLEIWDLKSSRSAVLFRQCALVVSPVERDFLDEFLQAVEGLNSAFVLYYDREYDYTDIGRGWSRTCTFDYIPADGSANTEHGDFVISLYKYSDGRIELSWNWAEGIELVDTGLRAEGKPKSRSRVTYFVPEEAGPRAGALSGLQFMDPLAYFQLQESDLRTDREGTRVFDVLYPQRDVLAQFIAHVEKLNPEFVLAYANEVDYTEVGGNWWLTYSYRYTPADGNYRGLDPEAQYHFEITIDRQITGEGWISWNWAAGVELVDAGLRVQDMPTLAGNSGGSSGGGNTGGSGNSGYDDDDGDEEHRRPCPYCLDGTEDCSRCDGDGGKWIYTSVPDYDGDGYTQKKTWQSCSKCHGTGEQDCHWCDGDEWIEY